MAYRTDAAATFAADDRERLLATIRSVLAYLRAKHSDVEVRCFLDERGDRSGPSRRVSRCWHQTEQLAERAMRRGRPEEEPLLWGWGQGSGSANPNDRGLCCYGGTHHLGLFGVQRLWPGRRTQSRPLLIQ